MARQVVQAIPNALGALCLNENGQAQLKQRPSIIPAIFSIFTSERHLKVLLDKENAVLIGTAIDELIRHHPSLKAAVFESLNSTFSKIEDLGNAYEVPEDLKKWYRLVPSPAPPLSSGDSMEGIESGGTAVEPLNEGPGERDPDVDEEDTTAKSHDNTVVSFIDIMGRVRILY